MGTRIRVYYRAARHFTEWNPVVDENGKIKDFYYAGFDADQTVYGKYQFFDLSPGIVTSAIQIELLGVNQPNVQRLEFCYFVPFGCYDHEAYGDLQLYSLQKSKESIVMSAAYDYVRDKKKMSYIDKNYDVYEWKLPTRNAQPGYLEGCAVFDFENGDIGSWTQTGEAFKHQPTFSDTKFLRQKYIDTGIVGDWWISTRENHPHSSAKFRFQGFNLEGSITSPKFRINATRYSFLIGGNALGRNMNVGVQLIIVGRVVREYKIYPRSRYNYNFEEQDRLKRVYWSLGNEFYGQEARLRLVDGKGDDGYIMFDDFRTWDKCDDYSQPLGMENEKIKLLQISDGNMDQQKHGDYNKLEPTISNPKFKTQNSRVMSGFQYSDKIYKGLLPERAHVHRYPSAYLQVDLIKLHLIDGWAFQGNARSSFKKMNCYFSSYIVAYERALNQWLSLSIRKTVDEKVIKKMNPKLANNEFPTMAKNIVFWHPFEYTKPTMDRRYLNPRIKARKIRFIMPNVEQAHKGGYGGRLKFSEMKDINFVCMRLELYGKDIEDSQDELTKKQEKVKEELETKYSLQYLSVAGNQVKAGNIELECYNSSHILNAMTGDKIKRKWFQTLYTNIIPLLKFNDIKIKLPLKKGFRQHTITCKAYFDQAVVMTKDFVIFEKATRDIALVVTQDVHPDMRAGKLSHENPPKIYTDGFKPLWFSISIANLFFYEYHVPRGDFCPNGFAEHKHHYKYKLFCKKLSTVDAMFKCTQEAYKRAYVTLSHSEKSGVFGGLAVHTWRRGHWRSKYYDENYNEENIQREEGTSSNIRYILCFKNLFHERNFYSSYCHLRDCPSKAESIKTYSGTFYKKRWVLYYEILKIEMFLNDGLVGGTQRFYSRKWKIQEWLDYWQGEDSRRIFPVTNNQLNPFQLLQYHNCDKDSTVDLNVEEEHSQKGGCSTFLSMHGQEKPGFGHIATLIFTNRDFIIYNKPRQVRLVFTLTGNGRKKNERHTFINIENQSTPYFKVQKNIGICNGQNKQIKAELVYPDKAFADKQKVAITFSRVMPQNKLNKEERKVSIHNRMQGPIMGLYLQDKLWSYHWNQVLYIYYANEQHNGVYEVMAQSRYFVTVTARFDVKVYYDYPMITWQTPSPFYAIKGVSDVLQIKTSMDDYIDDITWMWSGKEIQNDKNFSFIDFASRPEEKKRLQLINIGRQSGKKKYLDFSGTYTVNLKGSFCSFSTKIDVIVHVAPRVTLTPKQNRKSIPYFEDSKAMFKVFVDGGVPRVEVSGLNFLWIKLPM
uniref:Uncharacterized protein n=2 Tax=Clytia hemisphaerica TaxID=252671 RepID=A0A7M5VE19_9CNID